jgi:hypothetical protein
MFGVVENARAKALTAGTLSSLRGTGKIEDARHGTPVKTATTQNMNRELLPSRVALQV